jgi:hypothetical protein
MNIRNKKKEKSKKGRMKREKKGDTFVFLSPKERISFVDAVTRFRAEAD